VRLRQPASVRPDTRPDEAAEWAAPETTPLGLYLHVPFCTALCPYCTFPRGLYDASLARRYVAALAEEIRRAGDGSLVDTIYFGGGTPSLLAPDEVACLLETCREAFRVAPEAEITLEANPDTLDLTRLAGYRAAGVNRLSVGAQSFRDEELQRLGRQHTAARTVAAVQAAREAGFDNLNVDLIGWLPGQRLADWLESIEALVALAPEHASLYLLELYPHVPLAAQMARAGWGRADEDEAAEMYLQGLARLDAVGYEQYEISNVARPGRRARHNLKYWTGGAWIGFGAGAHSTRTGRRWRNVAAVEAYLQRIEAGVGAAVERQRLSLADQLAERLIMGLRLVEGVDLAEIAARYGVDVWARFGADLAPFLDLGLLVREGARLRLTRSGMLVANEIMRVFL
jgi:oxygen-independent coproporphyrinogen-3 oxidase